MEASTSSSSGTLSRADMPELPREASEDAEKRPNIERDLSKYPPTSHASSSAYMLDHEQEGREGFFPRRASRAWEGWWRRVEVRHPRVHRVGMWLWGPRPKIDLPPPNPWVFQVHWKGHTYGRLIEPTFTRYTRHLTHPYLFILLAAAYIISVAFFSRAQSFFTPASSYIDCTSTYWLANAGCGLDGDSCGPFDFGEASAFDFRCPAQCKGVELANPRFIGNESIEFVPLIVGGGDADGTYRGDSFICAAAEQAGLISDSKGGCARLELVANFTNFIPFTAHGLSSIGFPSQFPVSFRFSDSTPLSHCTDLRNPALAFNAIITFILFAFLRPKPVVLYWCLVCIGFWHITLFSQPRSNPPDLADAFGTFLPALFVAYAFWRLAFRFTLPAILSRTPLEGAILYLLPYWVTVLNNLTIDRIPISRLTPEDIRAQPGGITALIIIIIVLFFVVINQVRVVAKTGWLPYYLGWYIAGGLVALVLALLPTLNLRVHHYFIAIVLMPGTAWPTRLNAIYQGLLLGLFLNGVAAFGFDSILQTAAQLQRDAALDTDTPLFLTNSTTYNASLAISNQSISWAPLPSGESWDGFALLVDDVERYAGAALNYSLEALSEGIPHFFRIAYTSGGTPGGFTRAATLLANGTWIDPLPGTT